MNRQAKRARKEVSQSEVLAQEAAAEGGGEQDDTAQPVEETFSSVNTTNTPTTTTTCKTRGELFATRSLNAIIKNMSLEHGGVEEAGGFTLLRPYSSSSHEAPSIVEASLNAPYQTKLFSQHPMLKAAEKELSLFLHHLISAAWFAARQRQKLSRNPIILKINDSDVEMAIHLITLPRARHGLREILSKGHARLANIITSRSVGVVKPPSQGNYGDPSAFAIDPKEDDASGVHLNSASSSSFQLSAEIILDSDSE